MIGQVKILKDLRVRITYLFIFDWFASKSIFLLANFSCWNTKSNNDDWFFKDSIVLAQSIFESAWLQRSKSSLLNDFQSSTKPNLPFKRSCAIYYIINNSIDRLKLILTVNSDIFMLRIRNQLYNLSNYLTCSKNKQDYLWNASLITFFHSYH